MFTLDFNPVLIDLGFFQVRWYSLFYIIGFLGLYVTLMFGTRKKIFQMDQKTLDDYIVWAILGIIIGGRSGFFLFYNLDGLIRNPLEFFMLWHGGMAFHGGLVGFILATYLFCRFKGILFWKILDISAVVGAFALMLGRIGNILNGELPGTIFSGSWCVVFPSYDYICRHPYPIYTLISHFLLALYLILLLYLQRKHLKKFIGKGILTAHFLVGYGVLRIITDIWKVDYIFFGFKHGQWLSLFMIIAGIVFIHKKPKMSKRF
jgi:phosphatidylglycerol---prolipoprotein diacylglyceryl transferase